MAHNGETRSTGGPAHGRRPEEEQSKKLVALQPLKERGDRAGPAKGPSQGLVGVKVFRHWKGKVRILISKARREAGREA